MSWSLPCWSGSVRWRPAFWGQLTGLGGGVVIVPLLVLAFHVDLRYAIGASLVSVIATSSGAAAAYVKEGYSNIRIGMFLEIATTFGALHRRVHRGRWPPTPSPWCSAWCCCFRLTCRAAPATKRRTPGRPGRWRSGCG